MKAREQFLNDTELGSKILSAMNASPDVDPLSISIVCTDGVVSLSGQVGSYAERVSAHELARSIADTKDVLNSLTVRDNIGRWKISDADIAHQVVTQLTKELGGRAASSILASVHCHVVTLTGLARTTDDRARARHVVEQIDGVDFVQNKLTIR